jgi:endonuclease/exonuclease/phosphatase family metal-dependent hydrolase
MKILTLNAWGGRIKEPLLDFIKKQKDNIDVFCFQEIFKQSSINDEEVKYLTNTAKVHRDLLGDISKILSNYNPFFCPVYKDIYGVAIFVKKDLNIIDSGFVTLYENSNFPDSNDPWADHNRKMQWVQISVDDKKLNVINLHGHWVTGNKMDNPARLKQSQIILDLINKLEGSKILCGDFNLRPDTESIKMIDEKMSNLIKKYNVKSTRTSLYKKSEQFADYVFVSPDITEKDFKVLSDEVSDHTAILIEI